MNPVPLMPLVELIRGLDTSDEAAAYVRAAAERMGKTVAEAHDHPGFISNRILVPMINEAVYCLMEGVGDRDSIDTVMQPRDEPSDGAAAARRPDRPGHLPGDHGGAPPRPRRRQVPALPAAAKLRQAGRLGRKSGRGFYDYGD